MVRPTKVTAKPARTARTAEQLPLEHFTVIRQGRDSQSNAKMHAAIAAAAIQPHHEELDDDA